MSSRFKRNVIIPAPSANSKRVRINPINRQIRDLKKLADEINVMLDILENAGYLNTWASKKLFNKIDNPMLDIVNRSSRINTRKINKHEQTKSELAYITKAFNEFKMSLTSTPRGIRKSVEFQRDRIREQSDLEEFANSLTEEEIADIYSIFSDEDYVSINEAGQFASATLFTMAIDTIEKDETANEFITKMKRYGNKEWMRDVNNQRKMRSIYKKYLRTSRMRLRKK